MALGFRCLLIDILSFYSSTRNCWSNEKIAVNGLIDWIGLVVVGFDWIGLHWIGLDLLLVEFDCIGLDWIGLDGLVVVGLPRRFHLLDQPP